ncbi:hypothetical protein W911_09115 [Hyphomicrobium nitrativorans NL23]|uniref:Anti-sigma factor n=1 Tax=Hyphomicrobium nitrativorans NL23 TaxID=1029756 RepID=V5SGY3_9HYPH|nr:hypothetical protein [Hyphomicrobium nitrativorans]AHB50141.1 hypothetical protein W911_09115 [Hyphomicrobium nitrativorans NL23]
MGQVTDEILMAYADGELSAEETEALEALLNRDATLRMRLAPFVVTRREIASTYEPTLDEQVPEHLVAAILRAPAPARDRTPVASTSENWLNRALTAIGSTLFPHGASLATAASVAVLVTAGALGGWLANQSAPSEEAGLIETHGSGLTASGALARALESTPSGTASAADANGAAIVPVMSFHQADSDGICREYRVRNTAAGEPDYAGLACRADDGVWRVAVHVETPKAATAQTETGNTYQTATGPNAPAVDAVADTLISGHALGRDEEKALLENGWRPASS